MAHQDQNGEPNKVFELTEAQRQIFASVEVHRKMLAPYEQIARFTRALEKQYTISVPDIFQLALPEQKSLKVYKTVLRAIRETFASAHFSGGADITRATYFSNLDKILSPAQEEYQHILKNLLSSAIKSTYFGSEQLEDIVRGLQRFEEEPAPVEPKIVVATSEQLIRELSQSPQNLYKLSPRAFEEFVAEMLVRMGFLDVQLTKQTRDGGYDIMCFSSNIMGGLMHLVECKRYASDKRVGVSVVRELSHVVEKVKAHQGIIVTTASFSPDALQEARDVRRIETKDMEFLAKWLANYGQGYAT